VKIELTENNLFTILNSLELSESDIQDHDCCDPDCPLSNDKEQILADIAETIDVVMVAAGVGATLQ